MPSSPRPRNVVQQRETRPAQATTSSAPRAPPFPRERERRFDHAASRDGQSGARVDARLAARTARRNDAAAAPGRPAAQRLAFRPPVARLARGAAARLVEPPAGGHGVRGASPTATAQPSLGFARHDRRRHRTHDRSRRRREDVGSPSEWASRASSTARCTRRKASRCSMRSSANTAATRPSATTAHRYVEEFERLLGGSGARSRDPARLSHLRHRQGLHHPRSRVGQARVTLHASPVIGLRA